MPRSLYKRTLIVAAAMLLGAAGCAQTPQRPHEPVAFEQAEQAIQQADGHQAARHARSELRAARTKLSKAKAAQRFGDGVMAQRLAQQAWADAQLALARAEAASLEQRAEALRQRLGQPIEQARWSAQ